VSGGNDDGTVVTWNVASGDWLGEAAAGGGVIALVALDERQFAAGTKCGDVVFYKHDGGRGVEEVACVGDAHSDWIFDFAVCGGLLATASSDQTAAVWGVDSRERWRR
jgi:WD40 repeat protein